MPLLKEFGLTLDPVTAVNEIVDGMRLEVELRDGTVHTLPIDLDFSSLTAEESKNAFEIGGGNAGRVAAAFVALKANQTMNLSEEDLTEVVDVLAALIDGDETNLVIEDDPDGGTRAPAKPAPPLSPAALALLEPDTQEALMSGG
jgi:hypothetical protein